jgi:hypothetical protein
MMSKHDLNHVVSALGGVIGAVRLRWRSADVGRGDPELREVQSNTATE